MNKKKIIRCLTIMGLFLAFSFTGCYDADVIISNTQTSISLEFKPSATYRVIQTSIITDDREIPTETPSITINQTPTIETNFEMNSMIVFSGGETSEESHLFVMSMDGKNVRQLTSGDTWDEYPAWSPDGETIAFTSYEIDTLTKSGLYLINSDGYERRLLFESNEIHLNGQPAWSPDEKK